MKVKAEMLNFGQCDWAQVQCQDDNKTKTISIFVPLATQVYPHLTARDAVEKVARKRFKESGAFSGYD